MPEKMYLVCDTSSHICGCGEAFDTIETALAHLTAGDETGKSWLTSDEITSSPFVILPESEAL